jgi:hypothetical protein
MEISFIKAYSAPASGSYTRAKRRHADANKMVFEIYLDKKYCRSLHLLSEPIKDTAAIS